MGAVMTLKQKLKLLLKESDGLTSPEMAKITNSPVRSVRRAVRSIDGAYIDRWIKVNGQWAGVWELGGWPDCPRPE
jgi:hypothetical protein